MTTFEKETLYTELLKRAEALLLKEDREVTTLANCSALLKEMLPYASWAGFYLADGETLYLGPFQGKTACTEIRLGKGVCGVAAETRATQVVADVHQFPGHIACDEGSNSEIVVPIVKDGELYGVLDIDSYEFNSFDDLDKKHLELLAAHLIKIL